MKKRKSSYKAKKTSRTYHKRKTATHKKTTKAKRTYKKKPLYSLRRKITHKLHTKGVNVYFNKYRQLVMVQNRKTGEAYSVANLTKVSPLEALGLKKRKKYRKIRFESPITRR